MNWISATEDVQLLIIAANLWECLEHAEKFAAICDFNMSLAATVNELKAAEPVQDAPTKGSAVALQEINTLQEELQIKKRHSTKFEWQPNKCKSEPEVMEPTDISQLEVEKDMPLNHVQNLSLVVSSLESEVRVFEHIIPQLVTNQLHPTLALDTSELTQSLSGFHGSSQPTPDQSRSRCFTLMSSWHVMFEGKLTLYNVTAIYFASK